MSYINYEVDIKLDRDRKLKLNMNAYAAFHKEIGKPWDYFMAKVMEAFQGGKQPNAESLTLLDFMQLRAILWAGLLHQDRTLTVESVGDLMEFAPGDDYASKSNYIFWKVIEAWSATKPAETKKKLSEVIKQQLEILPTQ